VGFLLLAFLGSKQLAIDFPLGHYENFVVDVAGGKISRSAFARVTARRFAASCARNRFPQFEGIWVKAA
jgi:hypothetical protein